GQALRLILAHATASSRRLATLPRASADLVRNIFHGRFCFCFVIGNFRSIHSFVALFVSKCACFAIFNFAKHFLQKKTCTNLKNL
ncbi:MAG: hypothetical protein OXE98_02480, partial [Hyphomicrobiales bacterium]|nr:hypothetical protein [Hyphomicrobiales bacterium]